ncbi:MAG: hypothetical protein M3O55_03220 [Actinomycetota bacterium]|nr:hypothetical protein [Actinomycetota bacterium]
MLLPSLLFGLLPASPAKNRRLLGWSSGRWHVTPTARSTVLTHSVDVVASAQQAARTRS